MWDNKAEPDSWQRKKSFKTSKIGWPFIKEESKFVIETETESETIETKHTNHRFLVSIQGGLEHTELEMIRAELEKIELETILETIKVKSEQI